MEPRNTPTKFGWRHPTQPVQYTLTCRGGQPPCAAGFIGLFGYIGRTVQAKGFGAMLHYTEGIYGKEFAWNLVIYSILDSTAIAVVFLALTWRVKPQA